jgi:DNA-binding transcriptional ArsR family regulator
MKTGNNGISDADMLDDVQLTEASEMLKLLAHPCRLRLLEFLAERELPVNTLVELTGEQQSTISGHLRRMKIGGVVASEHRGREVWYSLENRCVVSLLNCMNKYYGVCTAKIEEEN